MIYYINFILLLGDKESMAQSLSDSTTISNKETHNKDLTSFAQYDCDSYTYPYSTYYGNNKTTMDIAWEKFWSKNGEQLIWTSWIEKYADYINPDYFQNNTNTVENESSQDAQINEVREKYFEQNTCFPNQAHRNCEFLRSNFTGIFNKSNSSDGELKPTGVSSSNTSFSFEQMSRQEINDKDADENRKKIINFEISPEDGDGWNPLSPFSIEENYNQQSNAEDERLLTRCDSINGSIAKTNATSDSMTNVTKMTLTSSSCDSNSVHSSSLITSVTSSIESSITSSCSDQENELSEDNDKYWQHLWKENFQMQYQKQYELFIANYKKKHNIDNDQYFSMLNESIGNSVVLQQEETPLQYPQEDINNQEFSGTDIHEDEKDKSTNVVQIDITTSSKANSSGNKNMKRNSVHSKSNKLRTERLIMDSVGTLIRNLSIKTQDESIDAAEDENTCERQQNYTQVAIITRTKTETIASNSIISNSCQQKSPDGGDESLHEEIQEIYQERYIVIIMVVIPIH